MIAIVGFVWGVYTYQQTAMRTASKPYYDRQLDLYFQTARAAATLATDPRPDEWHKARREFWSLYWGPLSMVEDATPYRPETESEEEPRTVEAAMVRFGRSLRQIEDSLPAGDASPARAQLEQLQRPSLWLAHRLRDSLRGAWPVQGELHPRDEARQN